MNEEAIPKKKKCKKAKRLSEENLHTAEKIREAKGKGEKIYSSECKVPKESRERQKAIPREQCKEIEENNRMGKTRDVYKKIRDTKGTFHAKMGSIKDRNGMDLTEAEDIKKRWPKYWSFSFNISPSNERSGLISFRMGWLDLLAVQGTLKSLLQHHSSKASILWHSAFSL